MKISVFGAGYVGTVSAACLANDGHEVVAVDTNAAKIQLLHDGQSPIVEAGVGELLAEASRAGRLSATGKAAEAITRSDVALVCVGTPSRSNGDLDLTYVRRVCEDIGQALQSREEYFSVVIRSTLLPGTTRDTVIPVLESASGKRATHDFGVGVYPEFLREGSAVSDYYSPPKTVVAGSDDRTVAALMSLVPHGDAPIFQTDIPVAEMTKYVDNSWHALKVAFANEIGSVSKVHGVDAETVMDIFAADEKLNISAAYLRPGFAFGGSCLPKDVRALTYRSRHLDLATPLLNSILPSNRDHLDRAMELVVGRGCRRVGVLGLSFKSGTDDVRESPIMELIERLLGKGYDLRIYDPTVDLARLVGANREQVLARVPHLAAMLASTVEEVIDHGDVVVVGNRNKLFASALSDLDETKAVVDLVGLASVGAGTGGSYYGLCW